MTIRSSRDGPLPSFADRTVIVGAGAVGITMAVALARAGLPVTVLEGGPREPRADFRAANTGPLTGDPYPGLTEGRMKAYGGTTRLWGGQLVAFEPRDFERRDEAGDRLWPIGFDEFLPWVDAAYDLLGVSRDARDARAIWQRATGYDPDLGEGLTMGMNIWLKEPDFTRLFAHELTALPGLEVITDCPVAALRFAEDGETALELAPPDGSRPVVHPERIVLASGTIEIGGMLLRAATTEPNCPFAGNRHLGRWYFDHLHGLVGEVEIADKRAVSAMFDHVYFEGRKYGARIRGAGHGANAAATLNPALTPRQLASDALLLARRVLKGGGGFAKSLRSAVELATKRSTMPRTRWGCPRGAGVNHFLTASGRTSPRPGGGPGEGSKRSWV